MHINISTLCDFIEHLCASTVVTNSCQRGGLHGVALPRSWLLRQLSKSSLPTELAKQAPKIYWMLLDSMAALLENIYTGVGAGECNSRLFPSQILSLNLLTSKNTFSSTIRVSQLYGVSVGCLLLACAFSPIRTQITKDLSFLCQAAELYAFVSFLYQLCNFLYRK